MSGVVLSFESLLNGFVVLIMKEDGIEAIKVGLSFFLFYYIKFTLFLHFT